MSSHPLPRRWRPVVVLPILAPREGIRISALRVSANGTMYLRPMGGAG